MLSNLLKFIPLASYRAGPCLSDQAVLLTYFRASCRDRVQKRPLLLSGEITPWESWWEQVVVVWVLILAVNFYWESSIFCKLSVLHLFYALICTTIWKMHSYLLFHRWGSWDLKVKYLAQGRTTIIISADGINTYISLLPIFCPVTNMSCDFLEFSKMNWKSLTTLWMSFEWDFK